MHIKWMIIFLAAIIVTGCRFQCSVGDGNSSSKQVSGSESTGPMKGAIIRNDIELDAKDVKIKEAYLLNENRQLLEKNETEPGQRIRCSVVFDTGWTKYDGKSFIGASEKIMTEDGRVILDEPDLFKDYSQSGLPAEDAKVVSVVAIITNKQPGVDNYKVQFRIWNKRGSGEVTGRFKFKVN